MNISEISPMANLGLSCKSIGQNKTALMSILSERRTDIKKDVTIPLTFFVADGPTCFGIATRIVSRDMWIQSNVQLDPGEAVTVYSTTTGFIRSAVIGSTHQGFIIAIEPFENADHLVPRSISEFDN